jgi:hypothetical protein
MPVTKGSNKHVFGRTRPSHDGDYYLTEGGKVKEIRVTTFHELPPPTGSAPYHLDIKDVVSTSTYNAMVKAGELVFHVNGDMGGINFAVPQQLVANGMEADFSAATGSMSPRFLYILGDCVYFNGEVSEYYAQFYEPYEHYLAPIFAVPGNHDGENMQGQSSLDGFVRNFCAPQAVHMPEAGDSPRTAMTQPNVYWTLRTPFVNIVGIYSNVPAHGDVDPTQTAWFTNELKTLPKGVPLLVTLHHPIFSADIKHSGSAQMKQLIDDASKAAGRRPDMVLAGHVHDYQRFTRDDGSGRVTPYIVAGAGGYHNLHAIQKVNNQKMATPVNFHDPATGEDVMLESYVDDHHGFLRLKVKAGRISGRYFTVPRPQDSYSKGSQLVDRFEFNWKTGKMVPNQL